VKFLNTLLENNDLDPSIKEEVIESYKLIKEKVKGLGILMDEDAEFMFSNHILSFLKRVKSHSFVEDMSQEFDQISPHVFSMAEGLIKEFFEKESIPINKTEVFLVATHLEIAIQKQEEEVRNE
jgi:transcriptional regulatory protein LevR